jgi:cell division protein FtsQ
MLPVFGEDIGRNVFFVNLSERRRHLEEIPLVENATVMRLLPDRIQVRVVERQPVAFVRQGQQIGLVDANGVLLLMPAAAMAEHHYSFPVVTGIDPGDPLPSRKARMAMYGRLLAELDADSHNFSGQVSEIDLTDAEDARVMMPEQGTDILAHFGNDRFLERFQRYKTHIAEWRQQYPKLSAVDLRYDQQVVLEMSPGTNTVEAAVGDQAAAGTSGGKTAAEGAVTENPAKPKAGQTASAAPGETAPAKQSTGAKRLNAIGRPVRAGGATAKQKTAAARAKAAKDKKRAQVQRATLNGSKRAPTTHPAAASGQGQ